MQTQNKSKEQSIRRFLYPRNYEYERERREIQRSPRRISYSTNEFATNKPKLHFQYDDQQSVSSYILNKELNRNALGYPRDEVHFSVLDNNYRPFSYLSRPSKNGEGKIYHYSIASRKDYNREKDDHYSTYYLPEQRSGKYYIENRIPYEPKNRNYYLRRQEENILPTKVYISDSYVYNSQDTSKFRPSREKDGNKGGIVNLRRNKYETNNEMNDEISEEMKEEVINDIVLIQRWWRDILNRNKERNEYDNEYQYYPRVASRKTYSKGNERITEKIIPGENDKFIIQTTKVEVYKSPYMNIPLLKPEIITKETKLKQRKMNIEASNDFEIVLDKESLKQHMRNIWNEDNMINTIDSLSIIQNEPINFNGTNMTQIKKTTIEEYEEQIRQLKKALNKKETEIIEYSNKLKSLPTKNLEENIPTKEDINENYLNDLISNKWMKENLNLKNIELSISRR